MGEAGLYINVVAVIYLTFTSIFLLFPLFRPVTAANMNYASVVLGGALLFGCVYWPFKARGRYVGPLTGTEVWEGRLN